MPSACITSPRASPWRHPCWPAADRGHAHSGTPVIATGGEILGAGFALAFSESLTEGRTAAVLALVAGIMITLSVAEIAPSGFTLLRRDENPAPAQR